MKRIGAAAAMAAMTIVVAALSGVALADGTKPDKPAPPPKAAHHEQSKPAQPAKAESASKPDEQKASEPEAKVYICHATGSDSNPYVLIHVSSHALKAHTSHQDGRDIVLGASPGTCPGASTTSNVKAAEHSESSAASVQGVEAMSCSNDDDQAKSDEKAKQHDDNGRGDDKNGEDRDQKAKAAKADHEDNGDNKDNDDDNCPAAASSSSSASQLNLSAVSASNNVSSNTASSSNTAATSSNTAATSNAASTASSPVGENANAGVLGATKALSAPKAAKQHANAGVLGTVAALSTSGTLPFSGIRLWIVELVALGLIGLGVATRMIVRRRPN